MPLYQMTLPDGRTFDLEAPAGTPKTSIVAELNRQTAAGRGPGVNLGYDPLSDSIYAMPEPVPAADQPSALGGGFGDGVRTLAAAFPGLASYGLEGLRRAAGGAEDGWVGRARDWTQGVQADLMEGMQFDTDRHGVGALAQGNVLGPLAYWTAYAIPQAAAYATGAGAGATLGRMAVGRAAAPAAQAAAASRGGLAGGLGVGIGQETGHIYGQAVENAGAAGEVDLLRAGGAGIAAGSLDAASMGVTFGLGGLGRFAGPLAEVAQGGGRLRSAATRGGLAAVQEGATEAGQEIIGGWGAVTPWEQVVAGLPDAALGGAIGGGAIGGAAAAVRNPGGQPPPPAADWTQPEPEPQTGPGDPVPEPTPSPVFGPPAPPPVQGPQPAPPVQGLPAPTLGEMPPEPTPSPAFGPPAPITPQERAQPYLSSFLDPERYFRVAAMDLLGHLTLPPLPETQDLHRAHAAYVDQTRASLPDADPEAYMADFINWMPPQMREVVLGGTLEEMYWEDAIDHSDFMAERDGMTAERRREMDRAGAAMGRLVLAKADESPAARMKEKRLAAALVEKHMPMAGPDAAEAGAEFYIRGASEARRKAASGKPGTAGGGVGKNGGPTPSPQGVEGRRAEMAKRRADLENDLGMAQDPEEKAEIQEMIDQIDRGEWPEPKPKPERAKKAPKKAPEPKKEPKKAKDAPPEPEKEPEKEPEPEKKAKKDEPKPDSGARHGTAERWLSYDPLWKEIIGTEEQDHFEMMTKWAHHGNEKKHQKAHNGWVDPEKTWEAMGYLDELQDAPENGTGGVLKNDDGERDTRWKAQTDAAYDKGRARAREWKEKPKEPRKSIEDVLREQIEKGALPPSALDDARAKGLIPPESEKEPADDLSGLSDQELSDALDKAYDDRDQDGVNRMEAEFARRRDAADAADYAKTKADDGISDETKRAEEEWAKESVVKPPKKRKGETEAQKVARKQLKFLAQTEKGGAEGVEWDQQNVESIRENAAGWAVLGKDPVSEAHAARNEAAAAVYNTGHGSDFMKGQMYHRKAIAGERLWQRFWTAEREFLEEQLPMGEKWSDAQLEILDDSIALAASMANDTSSYGITNEEDAKVHKSILDLARRFADDPENEPAATQAKIDRFMISRKDDFGSAAKRKEAEAHTVGYLEAEEGTPYDPGKYSRGFASVDNHDFNLYHFGFHHYTRLVAAIEALKRGESPFATRSEISPYLGRAGRDLDAPGKPRSLRAIATELAEVASFMAALVDEGGQFEFASDAEAMENWLRREDGRLWNPYTGDMEELAYRDSKLRVERTRVLTPKIREISAEGRAPTRTEENHIATMKNDFRLYNGEMRWIHGKQTEAADFQTDFERYTWDTDREVFTEAQVAWEAAETPLRARGRRADIEGWRNGYGEPKTDEQRDFARGVVDAANGVAEDVSESERYLMGFRKVVDMLGAIDRVLGPPGEGGPAGGTVMDRRVRWMEGEFARVAEAAGETGAWGDFADEFPLTSERVKSPKSATPRNKGKPSAVEAAFMQELAAFAAKRGVEVPPDPAEADTAARRTALMAGEEVELGPEWEPEGRSAKKVANYMARRVGGLAESPARAFPAIPEALESGRSDAEARALEIVDLAAVWLPGPSKAETDLAADLDAAMGEGWQDSIKFNEVKRKLLDGRRDGIVEFAKARAAARDKPVSARGETADQGPGFDFGEPDRGVDISAPPVTDEETLNRMHSEMNMWIDRLVRDQKSPRVRVFRTVEEMVREYNAHSRGSDLDPESELAKGTYGLTFGRRDRRRTYFALESMNPKKSALGYLMHEAGVHIGLESRLGEDEWTALGDKVFEFLDGGADTEANEAVAAAARRRMLEAGYGWEDHDSFPGEKMFREIWLEGMPEEAHRLRAEAMAYLLEETANAGIAPRAAKGKLLEVLDQVLKFLADAAERVLGMRFRDAPLDLQDFADLAWGAAATELSANFHGSGVGFSRFETSKMGTGEGSQAYGFGHYMADARPVAQSYMQTEVRKRVKDAMPPAGGGLFDPLTAEQRAQMEAGQTRPPTLMEIQAWIQSASAVGTEYIPETAEMIAQAAKALDSIPMERNSVYDAGDRSEAAQWNEAGLQLEDFATPYTMRKSRFIGVGFQHNGSMRREWPHFNLTVWGMEPETKRETWTNLQNIGWVEVADSLERLKGEKPGVPGVTGGLVPVERAFVVEDGIVRLSAEAVQAAREEYMRHRGFAMPLEDEPTLHRIIPNARDGEFLNFHPPGWDTQSPTYEQITEGQYQIARFREAVEDAIAKGQKRVRDMPPLERNDGYERHGDEIFVGSGSEMAQLVADRAVEFLKGVAESHEKVADRVERIEALTEVDHKAEWIENTAAVEIAVNRHPMMFTPEDRGVHGVRINIGTKEGIDSAKKTREEIRKRLERLEKMGSIDPNEKMFTEEWIVVGTKTKFSATEAEAALRDALSKGLAFLDPLFPENEAIRWVVPDDLSPAFSPRPPIDMAAVGDAALEWLEGGTELAMKRAQPAIEELYWDLSNLNLKVAKDGIKVRAQEPDGMDPVNLMMFGPPVVHAGERDIHRVLAEYIVDDANRKVLKDALAGETEGRWDFGAALASFLLHQGGIKGIIFEDGNSRYADRDLVSWNRVVFHEDDVVVVSQTPHTEAAYYLEDKTRPDKGDIDPEMARKRARELEERKGDDPQRGMQERDGGGWNISRVADPETLDAMQADMDGWLKRLLPGKTRNERIHVFRTTEEAVEFANKKLEQKMDAEWEKSLGTFGFAVRNKGTRKKHAVFILEHMDPEKSALSYLMHEAGAHVGLEGILGEEEWAELTDRVLKFLDADHAPGSLEFQVAEATRRRLTVTHKPFPSLRDIKTGKGRTRFTQISRRDHAIRAEAVAYLLEESVNAGIRPDLGLQDGTLARIIKDIVVRLKDALWWFFESEVNGDALNLQALADMAWSAAAVEVLSSYHGTGVDFTRFDVQQMGTGEGAQAFGFGHYLASSMSTALHYLRKELGKALDRGSSHTDHLNMEPPDPSYPVSPLQIKEWADNWVDVDSRRAPFSGKWVPETAKLIGVLNDTLQDSWTGHWPDESIRSRRNEFAAVGNGKFKPGPRIGRTREMIRVPKNDGQGGTHLIDRNNPNEGIVIPGDMFADFVGAGALGSDRAADRTHDAGISLDTSTDMKAGVFRPEWPHFDLAFEFNVNRGTMERGEPYAPLQALEWQIPADLVESDWDAALEKIRAAVPDADVMLDVDTTAGVVRLSDEAHQRARVEFATSIGYPKQLDPQPTLMRVVPTVSDEDLLWIDKTDFTGLGDRTMGDPQKDRHTQWNKFMNAMRKAREIGEARVRRNVAAQMAENPMPKFANMGHASVHMAKIAAEVADQGAVRKIRHALWDLNHLIAEVKEVSPVNLGTESEPRGARVLVTGHLGNRQIRAEAYFDATDSFRNGSVDEDAGVNAIIEMAAKIARSLKREIDSVAEKLDGYVPKEALDAVAAVSSEPPSPRRMAVARRLRFGRSWVAAEDPGRIGYATKRDAARDMIGKIAHGVKLSRSQATAAAIEFSERSGFREFGIQSRYSGEGSPRMMVMPGALTPEDRALLDDLGLKEGRPPGHLTLGVSETGEIPKPPVRAPREDGSEDPIKDAHEWIDLSGDLRDEGDYVSIDAERAREIVWDGIERVMAFVAKTPEDAASTPMPKLDYVNDPAHLLDALERGHAYFNKLEQVSKEYFAAERATPMMLYEQAASAMSSRAVPVIDGATLGDSISFTASAEELAEWIEDEATRDMIAFSDEYSGFSPRQAVVSALLHQGGVPGILFRDGSTRHKHHKKVVRYNRVIFNDDDLMIVGRQPHWDIPLKANQQRRAHTTDIETLRERAAEIEREEDDKIQRGMQAINDARRQAGESVYLEQFGKWGRNAKIDFDALWTKASDGLRFLSDFVKRHSPAMPALGDWHSELTEAVDTRNSILREVEVIVSDFRKLGAAGRDEVNEFLADATFERKWAYQPERALDDHRGEVEIDEDFRDRFEDLTREQQAVIRAVFGHGERMRLRKQRIAEEAGADPELFREEWITGPYAPLRRFGNHVGELKSAELAEMEALLADEPGAELERQISEMKSHEEHYIVSFFDTPSAAREFVDTHPGDYAVREASEKAPRVMKSDSSHAQMLEGLLGRLGAGEEMEEVDPQTREAFRQMLRDAYFDQMDERSARLSLAARRNRHGFERNMMRSFLTHARAEAALVANMEHGRAVNEAFVQMQREAKQDRETLQPVFNNAARHYRDLLDPPVTPIQDRLAAVNSLWMLTSSIGYHVTNATQPAMVTVPRIAGDFGDYTGTWDRLVEGYKVAWATVSMAKTGDRWWQRQAEIDPEKADARYRGMLTDLQQRGLLDVGLEEDLGEFDRSETGYAAIDRPSSWMSGFIDRMFQIARYVEAYNRVAASVAAYDAALANPDRLAELGLEADQYAIEVVQDTQGNFSRLDAPLFVKALPKLTVQYRKYQIMMGWAFINAYEKGFQSASPVDREIGRRTLSLLLAHGAVLAGTAGVPMLNMAVTMMEWAWGLFSEEDEPFDMEREIRAVLGDNALADMVTRGVPSLFGLDMSLKLSHEGLFLPLPYADLEWSRQGVMEALFQGFMGPSGTTVLNMGRVGEYLDRGEYVRAMEYTLPKGARTALESARYASRGMTTPGGDAMLDPRDIPVKDLLINALGLQATKINKLKWRRGQQHEIEVWFGGRAGEIRRRYVEARNSGAGREAEAAIEAEWERLQDQKDNLRPFFSNAETALRRQKVSDLRDAVRDQERRQDRLKAKLGTD